MAGNLPLPTTANRARLTLLETGFLRSAYPLETAKLLASTLRLLSTTAAKAPKDERPTAYADLLTICVACHGAVRKSPP